MKLRELKDLVDRAVATSQDYEDDKVMLGVIAFGIWRGVKE